MSSTATPADSIAGPSSGTAARRNPLDTDAEVTMDDFLAQQDALDAEAKEIMPFSIDVCSWSEGHVKQSVWACKDCGGKGLCYGCSISCHGKHDLVELSTRRNFRCDCPTDCRPYDTVLAPSPTSVSTSKDPTSEAGTSSSSPCTLFKPSVASEYRTQPLPHPVFNEKNKYDRCFKGEFCRCGRSYDPLTERESMVGCLACEDWFHESCLNLQDPAKYTSPPAPQKPDPSSFVSTLVPELKAEAKPHINRPTVENVEEDEDEDESPVLNSRAYDSMICGACVKKHDVLLKVAGTEGYMMIVPVPVAVGEDENARDGGNGKDWQSGWTVIGKKASAVEVDVQGKGKPVVPRAEVGASAEQFMDSSVVGEKRKVPEGSDIGSPLDTKRIRLDATPHAIATITSTQPRCTSPRPNAVAQLILTSLPDTAAGIHAAKGARGDIFLAEGAREGLCVCDKCSPRAKALPFPLGEEEIWEPPLDPARAEPEGTLEEMTTRMLSSLPRSQAIEAAHKFAAMKDQFQAFLQPFLGGNRVVTVADVQDFVTGMRDPATSSSSSAK